MINNKYNVPLPMALWLSLDDYDYVQDPYTISATTLLRSPRYIIGNLRTQAPHLFDKEIIENEVITDPTMTALIHDQIPALNYKGEPMDLQDRIASRVGTAVHSAIEHNWQHNYKEGLRNLGYSDEIINRIRVNPLESHLTDDIIPVYQEQRLYKQVPLENFPFVISGKYDMVLNGALHDFKTTSTYSWETGCNDEKYMMQGSIYRFLAPSIITEDTLTINFIFTNWSPNLSYKDNYPPAKAYAKTYDLLSYEETEMYILNKLRTLKKYWNTPIAQIPCCTEKELFSTPPVFKYYRKGYKEGVRATKNFSTYAEASKHKAEKGNFEGDIVEVYGKPFKCPFCLDSDIETMKLHSNNNMIIG